MPNKRDNTDWTLESRHRVQVTEPDREWLRKISARTGMTLGEVAAFVLELWEPAKPARGSFHSTPAISKQEDDSEKIALRVRLTAECFDRLINAQSEPSDRLKRAIRNMRDGNSLKVLAEVVEKAEAALQELYNNRIAVLDALSNDEAFRTLYTQMEVSQ